MAEGKSSLRERLMAVVEPIVTEAGLELVDLTWQKEAGRQFLRVFIDRPEGISLDDCAALSRALDGPLEALELSRYHLEVSSPGAERPLKTERDFTRFEGRLVHLRLAEPIEGLRTLQGALLGHGPDHLRLDLKGREVTVPRTRITAARLALAMPGPET